MKRTGGEETGDDSIKTDTQIKQAQLVRSGNLVKTETESATPVLLTWKECERMSWRSRKVMVRMTPRGVMMEKISLTTSSLEVSH